MNPSLPNPGLPASPAPDGGRILLVVSSRDVASGRVADAAARLGARSADRASAQSARCQLTLLFQGYEGAERPLLPRGCSS